jgi:integrase
MLGGRPLGSNITQQLNSEVWTDFYNSLQTKPTKDSYQCWIRKYLEWLGYKDGNCQHLLEFDNALQIQNKLIKFFGYLRDHDTGFSPRTLLQYYTALKSFYSYYDYHYTVNWDKVRKSIGRVVGKAIDRAYTYDEIRQLLNYASERQRVAILLMASSGMRVGAIASLKIRDLEYIREHNIFRIKVYRGEPEEYITFCSNECANAIQSYLDYRKRNGEIIVDTSPLLRNHFDIYSANSKCPQKGHTQTVANCAHTMASETITNEIYYLLYKAGLRNIKDIKKRHGDRYQVMVTHALRKFFKSRCMATEGMNPVVIEMFMGHDVGIEENYYKPLEHEYLNWYLKVVNNLTIDDTQRLKAKLEAHERNAVDYKQLQAENTQLQTKLEAQQEQINELRKLNGLIK